MALTVINSYKLSPAYIYKIIFNNVHKKNRFNSQISPQHFIENINKPSMFYCININS